MATGLTYVNQVGAVEGMNQAAPGTLIPDSFLRWSQDVLFDRAGLIRRRGPIDSTLSSVVTPAVGYNERVIGVTSCLNPLNERIIASVIYSNNTGGDLTTKVYFYKHNGTANVKQSGESALAAAFAENTIMDSKAALGGGAWIGLLEKYGVASDVAGSRQAMYFWRGGCGTEGNKTSAVVTNDSKTITGLNTSGLTSGMFVYVDTNKLIGTVKTIINGTSLELEKFPVRQKTFGATETLTFKNVRAYSHKHGRGLLTKTRCSNDNSNHPHNITSGDINTLAEGHWGAAGIGTTGGYNVYLASDNKWIGVVRTDVAAPPNDHPNVTNIQATLIDNQHIIDPINGEEYIMLRHVAEESPLVHNRTATNFTGVFNATYAGFQWFGCLGLTGETNRIVFSASHDPEAVDLSKDAADSIVIPGVEEMRGIAASNSGLVVFMEDKTYLIRGNTRQNFSLELLYPQGCISTSSIVETGGGVMWASRAGILYYDGATVRNFTSDNLGVYYTDGVTTFNPNNDNCYGFLYRDYAFFHFTKWNNTYKMVRYEPLYHGAWANSSQTNDDNTIIDAAGSAGPGLAGQDWNAFADDDLSWEEIGSAYNTPIGWDYEEETPNNMTFAIYLPTGAITTISNFAFRGATFQESTAGLKAIVGFVRDEARDTVDLVQVDTMLDSVTDGFDHKLSINSTRVGPDLYLQTRHYTVGDPILKKWFQRLMLNLMLERGAVRVDFIDSEDKDAFDVYDLKHKNWEVFTEKGLSWQFTEDTLLPKITSPAYHSWQNLENENYTWLTLLFADYERQTKRFSLRQTSVGFRLYQLNNYLEPYQSTPTVARRIQMDSWNLGFKPLRGGRV